MKPYAFGSRSGPQTGRPVAASRQLTRPASLTTNSLPSWSSGVGVYDTPRAVDQAISTYKTLADQKDGTLPVDGILMQLGRAYLDAGKQADAEQTFNRLVSEFPQSPFSGDALVDF